MTTPNFAAGNSERALLRKVRARNTIKIRVSGSYEELARSPQILRQRWTIFGEFGVSFTFIHIRTLRLRTLDFMAHPTRFERVTFAFGGQR